MNPPANRPWTCGASRVLGDSPAANIDSLGGPWRARGAGYRECFACRRDLAAGKRLRLAGCGKARGWALGAEIGSCPPVIRRLLLASGACFWSRLNSFNAS